MESYFSVEPRPLFDWGDHGRILQHGMGLTLPRQEGCMVLLRTGPFIPPITFPGWPTFDRRNSGIVVVDAVRTALEASDLTGLAFQPVRKGRIVWLPWHEWDHQAARPQVRPSEGEPENYILEEPHSGKASGAVGDLWELVPTAADWMHREVERDKDGLPFARFRVLPDRGVNSDFFCVKPTAMLMCSSRASQWIENRWPACLSFVPLEMV